MPFIIRLIVKGFSLDIRSGRAVVFSAGTRISLVVLPLALSLPDEWSSLIAVIIVTQTIVDFFEKVLIGALVFPFQWNYSSSENTSDHLCASLDHNGF
ncbi:hypothetical protein [Paenibacillus sp. UMB7766-LJ446]|uniref:hypothetical protein n=1 Tax=Paenibacillus sp. UMB7766-LJ446 TaxID=3046313 RepID=UPI0025511FAB|nr:hypothetical protein [Paenibacillus sp. UMB7766-LJ446]